jgi:hypothetical protein
VNQLTFDPPPLGLYETVIDMVLPLLRGLDRSAGLSAASTRH